MASTNDAGWQNLAEAVKNETDDKKLIVLVKKLCVALNVSHDSKASTVSPDPKTELGH